MLIIKKENGFTLVELMISIGLGLLIVAAGLFIFLNSLTNSRIQNGVSQVQDGGIFGLEYIANQVRLANFGNENRSLNDETAHGGIVLTTGLPTQKNINFAVGNGNATTQFDHQILTKSGGLSNVDVESDQLTIQFIAPLDMQNCEGENVFKGDRVVQRYFLRKENNKTDHDTNIVSLGLACVANNPATVANVNADPQFVTNFASTRTGEVVIPNVDYFGFLLGARIGNSYRYYTVAEYEAAAAAARRTNPAGEVPSIEMIKLAVLIRSQNEIKTAPITLSEYEILGKTVTLKTASAQDKTNKFARNVYVTTIALRNAFGDK